MPINSNQSLEGVRRRHQILPFHNRHCVHLEKAKMTTIPVYSAIAGTKCNRWTFASYDTIRYERRV